jgi:hypothetical protein
MRKRTSKLTLNRETLRALSTDELRNANGGAMPAPETSFIYSCVVSCTYTAGGDCTTSTTFAPTV